MDSSTEISSSGNLPDYTMYPTSTKSRSATATSTITSADIKQQDEGITMDDKDTVSVDTEQHHQGTATETADSFSTISSSQTTTESGIDTLSTCSTISDSKSDSQGHGDGIRDSPSAPLTGYVVGKQLDIPEKIAFPFTLRPCDKDGKNLPGTESHRLEDKGTLHISYNSPYCSV